MKETSPPGAGDPLTRTTFVVAGYMIEQELGRGAMGVVYRARQLSLDRVVALKMVLAAEHAGDEARARFRLEAEAAAHLQHPNIVQVYEVGQDGRGRPFLSLEFVAGGTLDERLQGEPQAPQPSAQLVEQLARAIHFAHQNGIVHRDLKPANVLLTPPEPASGSGARGAAAGGAEQVYGRPKISDFGLAKKLDADAGQTRSGDIVGTPAYMAPEQAEGAAARVGPAADTYALGAILYEMLTGRPPFKAATLLDTLRQVTSEEPVPPRRLRPKLPRDLETICLKCLQKDPRRRYASALDLADDLRRYLDGEPILARPVGGAERLWRWCLRNPVAVVLLVTVGIGSVIGLWHMSRLSDQMMRTAALQSLAHESAMLEDVNNLYASEVVKRAVKGGVVATHDYTHQDGAIPIPATFTIELGWAITKGQSGMSVRLYSDYPWPSRFQGGPRNDFERAALEHLRRNPREPFYRFEQVGGLPVVRYATARVMQQACVDCHNNHPESPKKDWKVGDVRGVLQIVRPLHREQAVTDDGLRGTWHLMGLVFVALLVATGLVLVVGNRRQRVAPGAE
jgi:hypothetical protein